MRFRSFLIVVFLSGCAMFGQLDSGLDALMGKSERQAFAVLGYPSSKQEFAGDIIYTWNVSSSGTLLLPQTATTYGTVGTTPVFGTTTYNQAVPVNYNCMIKLIAGQDRTLKSWEYNGNLAGCSSYIQRLNEYAKSAQPPLVSAPVPMDCHTDADCQHGASCRSTKGGGTECRPITDCHTDADCQH